MWPTIFYPLTLDVKIWVEVYRSSVSSLFVKIYFSINYLQKAYPIIFWNVWKTPRFDFRCLSESYFANPNDQWKTILSRRLNGLCRLRTRYSQTTMEQPVLDSNEDIMTDDCIRMTVCKYLIIIDSSFMKILSISIV